ncbi:tetratricopeptide repeat protein [Polynucleobacter sp. MWH-UH2A]|uniref:tetratricopeptide repeat protein n=1 Tax=Polynucleobacter sp. MWH-UH2A TaxID=1855617 RepID=UPI001BFD2849|nr:tetratricopeptide repeat protein [Polynucleobacter sp. MWH-UH2A]QWD63861.1 sel1 repeat family protein [Polynucleobacter sp. MWH-UH2A]
MSSVELGELNLRNGKNDAAFDIFFDLAQFELSADAQFALVKMCFDGLLKTEQAERLMNWLNRETARGNGYADYNLGLIHEQGTVGGKPDFKKAVEFYAKAIKEEVHDAFCNLGNIFITGSGSAQGVPQDINRGLELLEKGAQLGSRQAAYTVGSYYGKGEIVPVNHRKAFLYLTLASLEKHDQAKRVLLIMQHAVKEDFSRELEEAQHMYAKTQNMRQLYKLL